MKFSLILAQNAMLLCLEKNIMNDFTKDELIMIKRLTLQHVNQFRENSDCIDLMRKIQSLIDNYCDHEDSYEDFSYNPTRCKECDAITSR